MATVRFYRTKTSGIITLKFSIDRENRFEISTTERVPDGFWDAGKQRAKSKFKDHLGLNQSLDKISIDLIQMYRDNKALTINELRSMAKPLIKFGTTDALPEKKSLYTILSRFIELTKKEKDQKTAKKFEAIYKVRIKKGVTYTSGHLWDFDSNIAINELDNNFLDRWKQHLYDKGLVDNTVFKYIKALSQFLTWASERGHEVHAINNKLTHKTWEIIDRKKEPITFPLTEIDKIESLNITQELIDNNHPPEKQGRREYTVAALKTAQIYATIQYRTGQRISDVKSIQPEDFQGMVWKNRVVKGQRILGKVINIPFNNAFMKPAYDILVAHNFNLPTISEQKLNKNIKILCKLAGLTAPVTVVRWVQNKQEVETRPKCEWASTHIFRKSFITNALQFLPPKLVKDIAGISWSTLKHYEGQSDIDVVNESFNAIPVMKVS